MAEVPAVGFLAPYQFKVDEFVPCSRHVNFWKVRQPESGRARVPRNWTGSFSLERSVKYVFALKLTDSYRTHSMSTYESSAKRTGRVGGKFGADGNSNSHGAMPDDKVDSDQ